MGLFCSFWVFELKGLSEQSEAFFKIVKVVTVTNNFYGWNFAKILVMVKLKMAEQPILGGKNRFTIEIRETFFSLSENLMSIAR